jgi:N utilization substance protein B
MQSVYAVLQSRSDDLKKEEKFLLFNIHKSKDLYVLQLWFLVEVKNLAKEHIEIKKKKYLATEDDRNPNMKFTENAVVKAIENSKEIKEYRASKKLDLWKENREYVRVILDKMTQSEEYADYMSTRSSDFEQDRKFISFLFKEIVAPDEKLFDFYESTNLGWVDDYPLVNTMIMKTFKQMKPGYSFDLKDLNVKEDDEEFLLELFRKTLLHQDEFTDEIDKKTPNWDTERIADIDMILIKMALTEFLYFPSIPTKVTINEYIEIAKDYSTTKSSYFINGVLDKLLKEYDKSGKLKKIGRGLL